jgi:hypothetical protein
MPRGAQHEAHAVCARSRFQYRVSVAQTLRMAATGQEIAIIRRQ